MSILDRLNGSSLKSLCENAEVISEGKNKSFAKKAMAALALSASVLVPNVYANNDIHEPLPQIDSDNWQHVVNNLDSGLYENVFREGHHVSVVFPDDPYAGQAVIADMARYNIDDSQFKFLHDHYKKNENKNNFAYTHDHSSLDGGVDPNYTQIQITSETAQKYQHPELVQLITLAHEMMHHAGHQDSGGLFSEILLQGGIDVIQPSQEETLEGEIAAESAGVLYMAREGLKAGYSIEDIHNLIDTLSNEESEKMATFDTHFDKPALSVIADLILEHPQNLTSLSNDQIRDVALSIADASMDFNYKAELSYNADQSVDILSEDQKKANEVKRISRSIDKHQKQITRGLDKGISADKFTELIQNELDGGNLNERDQFIYQSILNHGIDNIENGDRLPIIDLATEYAESIEYEMNPYEKMFYEQSQLDEFNVSSPIAQNAIAQMDQFPMFYQAVKSELVANGIISNADSWDIETTAVSDLTDALNKQGRAIIELKGHSIALMLNSPDNLNLQAGLDSTGNNLKMVIDGKSSKEIIDQFKHKMSSSLGYSPAVALSTTINIQNPNQTFYDLDEAIQYSSQAVKFAKNQSSDSFKETLKDQVSDAITARVSQQVMDLESFHPEIQAQAEKIIESIDYDLYGSELGNEQTKYRDTLIDRLVDKEVNSSYQTPDQLTQSDLFMSKAMDDYQKVSMNNDQQDMHLLAVHQRER